jgi:hypothetical protein
MERSRNDEPVDEPDPGGRRRRPGGGDGPAPPAAGAEDPRVQAILKAVDATVAAGPFVAEWRSLEGFEVPAWYRDGKFGIFIHWGLYSVPAFGNEWYPRNMYQKGSPEFARHVLVGTADGGSA